MATKKTQQHRHFRISAGKGKHDYFVAASGAFFTVAFVHALRIFYNWNLVVAGNEVPLWLSWTAVVLAGLFSWRGWQHARN